MMEWIYMVLKMERGMCFFPATLSGQTTEFHSISFHLLRNNGMHWINVGNVKESWANEWFIIKDIYVNFKDTWKSNNGFPMGICPYFRLQYRNPYWICTKGHTSNPWNKCPKRGLMTMGGQIPIEKHYRSLHACMT